MEYFTRWPEAKATKTANSIDTATFIYEEIICRFEAPKVIQSDQGTHFVNEVIRELTKRFQIKHSLSSPYHSQSNGLVERFNKTLCEEIAKWKKQSLIGINTYNQYYLHIESKDLEFQNKPLLDWFTEENQIWRWITGKCRDHQLWTD